MIYYKQYKLYLEVLMLRRILAATMIGALALTAGCALHNPLLTSPSLLRMNR